MLLHKVTIYELLHKVSMYKLWSSSVRLDANQVQVTQGHLVKPSSLIYWGAQGNQVQTLSYGGDTS